jgi:DNA-binding winged helix-turn-helix (wHTH) protein/TolB-like protein/Flp pilus assembly protein TadD
MDVLVHLAANPERVVSKEELLTVVWGGAFVEEGALAQAIHSLRKALGDDARQPRFIQTVPKRGYRLVAGIEPIQDCPEIKEASPGPLSAKASILDQALASRWNAKPRLLAAVAALLVALVLWITWVERQNAKQSDPETSHRIIRVVVLAFEAVGKPDDPYFAAGLTREITTNLTLIPSIQVIPGRMAVGDQSRAQSPLEIAEQVKADYILSGTVGWIGQRVRVTPMLIPIQDKVNIWVAPFMGDARNPFMAQQEISRAVISMLDTTLTPEQKMAVGERSTKSLEAYRVYLQGLVLMDQPSYSPSHLEQAARMFEKAVHLDEEFAEAWAELSKVHSYLAFNTDRTATRREQARYATERAVAWGPALVSTRLAQAYFLYRCQEDYDGALEQLSAAASVAPHILEVIEMRGLLLRRKGRLLEAVALLKKASALKPREVSLVWNTAETYRALRQYEKADAYFGKAISLAPDVPFIYEQRALNRLSWTGIPSEARALLEEAPVAESYEIQFVGFYLDFYERKYQQALGRLSSPSLSKLPLADWSRLLARAVLAYEKLGRHEEARSLAKRNLSELRSLMDKYPRNQIYVAYTAVALAQLGHREEAVSLAEEAVLQDQHDAFSGPQIVEIQAMVDAIVGRRHEAVTHLAQLLSKSYRGAIGSVELRLDPVWDPLRGDEEFEALARHQQVSRL